MGQPSLSWQTLYSSFSPALSNKYQILPHSRNHTISLAVIFGQGCSFRQVCQHWVDLSTYASIIWMTSAFRCDWALFQDNKPVLLAYFAGFNNLHSNAPHNPRHVMHFWLTILFFSENHNFPFCSKGSQIFQFIFIMATGVWYRSFLSLIQASPNFPSYMYLYSCPVY